MTWIMSLYSIHIILLTCHRFLCMISFHWCINYHHLFATVDDDVDNDIALTVTLHLLVWLFVVYGLAVIFAIAFMTNLSRCLNFLLFSSNINLTVNQQRLFGVSDSGEYCSGILSLYAFFLFLEVIFIDTVFRFCLLWFVWCVVRLHYWYRYILLNRCFIVKCCCLRSNEKCCCFFHFLNKKFELMLTRHAKAYSSSGSVV